VVLDVVGSIIARHQPGERCVRNAEVGGSI